MCVRACVRACMRACVRACMRVCVLTYVMKHARQKSSESVQPVSHSAISALGHVYHTHTLIAGKLFVYPITRSLS